MPSDPRAAVLKHVRDLINNHCIARVPPGSCELPAMGGKGHYTWQFYLRRALLDPVCLGVVGTHFWETFADDYAAQPFQVAGVEAAAVPLIVAVVLEARRRGIRLNAFTIRKERKAYGLQNIIEGAPHRLPVVFIDDLTSPSHNALWHAVRSLRDARLRLYPKGYVLVRKQAREVSPLIRTSLGDVAIQSLFTLDDFSLPLDEYLAEMSATQKALDDLLEREKGRDDEAS